VRGNDISFIFQEPMTSLNPLHTLEKQIAEASRCTRASAGPEARRGSSSC
jgi:microcin C transport system ATP-binding protein